MRLAKYKVGRELSDVETLYIYSCRDGSLDAAALRRAVPAGVETGLFLEEKPAMLTAAWWTDTIATLRVEHAQAVLKQAHDVVRLAAAEWLSLTNLPPSYKPYILTHEPEYVRLLYDAEFTLEPAAKGKPRKTKQSRAARRAAGAVSVACRAWLAAHPDIAATEFGKAAAVRESAEAEAKCRAAVKAAAEAERERAEAARVARVVAGVRGSKVEEKVEVRMMEWAGEEELMEVVVVLLENARGEATR